MDIKLKRTVSSKSQGVALNDENYALLSASQQLIASLGETIGVDVVIAEYEDRKYVATATVLEIANKLA